MLRSIKRRMLKHSSFIATLVLLTTASPSHAFQVNAQISSNPHAAEPISTTPSQDEPEEEVCVSIFRVREKITLGRGRKKIEILFGGGGCEPPGSGISGLWVSRSGPSSLPDLVGADTCPVFRKQVDMLWARKIHHQSAQQSGGRIEIGSLSFQRNSALFDLKSNSGRLAAVRWLRRTLFLVEPCWNRGRDDRSRHVVPSLYRMLNIKHR